MSLIKSILIASLLALVSAGVADAHFGDHWFTTASKQAQAIEANYAVETATCRPIFPAERTRYNAHSFVNKTGNRVWDHFICAITSTVTGRTCLSIAHSTGRYMSDFYLSSYWYRGCGPRDLRRLG